MSKVKINTQQGDYAPTPTVALTDKIGNKLVGILEKKVESSTYPGQYSYLIEAIETNAPTQIYEKDTDTNTDVEIKSGDMVWLQGTTVLNIAFREIPLTTKVEVVYTGKGEAKKGRKPPYLFDIWKVED